MPELGEGSSPEIVAPPSSNVLLEGRLILGAVDAKYLDTMQDLPETITEDHVGTFEGHDYSHVQSASEKSREDFWKGKDKPYEAWTRSFVADMEAEEHVDHQRSLTRFFNNIGIDPSLFTAADAEKVYKRYFESPKDSDADAIPPVKMFVQDILNSYTADGKLQMNAIDADLESLQWVAEIFGEKEAGILRHYIHAEARLLSDKPSFIKELNDANVSVPVSDDDAAVLEHVRPIATSTPLDPAVVTEVAPAPSADPEEDDEPEPVEPTTVEPTPAPVPRTEPPARVEPAPTPEPVPSPEPAPAPEPIEPIKEEDLTEREKEKVERMTRAIKGMLIPEAASAELHENPDKYYVDHGNPESYQISRRTLLRTSSEDGGEIINLRGKDTFFETVDSDEGIRIRSIFMDPDGNVPVHMRMMKVDADSKGNKTYTRTVINNRQGILLPDNTDNVFFQVDIGEGEYVFMKLDEENNEFIPAQIEALRMLDGAKLDMGSITKFQEHDLKKEKIQQKKDRKWQENMMFRQREKREKRRRRRRNRKGAETKQSKPAEKPVNEPKLSKVDMAAILKKSIEEELDKLPEKVRKTENPLPLSPIEQLALGDRETTTITRKQLEDDVLLKGKPIPDGSLVDGMYESQPSKTLTFAGEPVGIQIHAADEDGDRMLIRRVFADGPEIEVLESVSDISDELVAHSVNSDLGEYLHDVDGEQYIAIGNDVYSVNIDEGTLSHIQLVGRHISRLKGTPVVGNVQEGDKSVERFVLDFSDLEATKSNNGSFRVTLHNPDSEKYNIVLVEESMTEGEDDEIDIDRDETEIQDSMRVLLDKDKEYTIRISSKDGSFSNEIVKTVSIDADSKELSFK